jgi:hypothetical protein
MQHDRVVPVDLTDAVDRFRRTGWVITRTLDDDAVTRVQVWIDELAARPDYGEWLHYRELTDDGPRLCRTENFVPSHEGLRRLLCERPMTDVASALLGETAVLYKEKVNYKFPGGAGFLPHQDARAYPFVDVHVSCMIAIDDATEANGCLEVVSGAHDELLPVDERGCVRPDVAASLAWTSVPIRAGDTLWFHSRTPHRSGPNRSRTPRRAIYPTYNALSAGDLRAAYYEDKRRALGEVHGDGDRVALSVVDDFEGRPVL